MRAKNLQLSTLLDLFRFIEEAGRPLITEFKQEHAHKIFEMEITHHFLLFVDKAHKDFDAMLNVVSSLLSSCFATLV